MAEILPQEISQIIKYVSTGKATGIDGFLAELFKLLVDTPSVLFRLFNDVFKSMVAKTEYI